MQLRIVYLAIAACCLGVAGTIEVHFENKDGGFFLKQIPRPYTSASAGASPSVAAGVGVGAGAGAGAGTGAVTGAGAGTGAGDIGDVDNDDGTILSVDRFQTSEPVSVRVSYGPFSIKQTVPARYIVPDPVDQLPGGTQESPAVNSSSSVSALVRDLQLAGARHLDMSAHIVKSDVARDQPVVRVLFHTGTDPMARRHGPARQQRVCIVLHASVPDKPPLTAACSPDGEDGVCLAQVTIPHTWWPPLPPPEDDGELGKSPPRKTPPRLVQLAHSVLEPRGSGPGCVPRVQIQPVTPLGSVALVPARSAYRELRADERLTILLPHAPLFPLSRMHLPVFLQPRPGHPRVTVLIVRARVKSGLRVLGAEASSDQWNVSVDISPKQTIATVTALRRPTAAEHPAQSRNTDDQDEDDDEDSDLSEPSSRNKRTLPGVSEVFSWLLEVVEDSAELWDEGRIVWSVRYVLEGAPTQTPTSTPPPPPPLDSDSGSPSAFADAVPSPSDDMLGDGVATMGGAAGGAVARSRRPRSSHSSHSHPHQHPHPHQAERHQLRDGLVEETRRKINARFEVQKDDVQAVVPISKNWEVVNTAVLTGRQVSKAMKVFIVSQAGRVADVTLTSSCHTEDDSVLKVSSSCTSVYVDGSEIRGSSNATVLVKYGTYSGMARFTVWMPQFPLEVSVQDLHLSQIKGWRVPDENAILGKSKRSAGESSETDNEDAAYRARDSWDHVAVGGMVVEDVNNGLDHERSPTTTTCRTRFQQTPVQVYARFKAEDHDSGRESYFVSRRTLLLVTDLVQGYLRVSDPRIATLSDRVLQGRSSGRTEVQVMSPITGRVVGAKEIRVGTDKVSITRMLVRVVSGLQLSINPDSTIENGYVAETSVLRKLTAQYQEGLLDIDIEFSDQTRTPLREVALSDYHLMVESLDSEVVAFAPMMASPHPRVIAVGQGRGDLLKVALLPAEACRGAARRSKLKSITSHVPLAVASAQVEVKFDQADVAPEFVQNDGGGVTGTNSKERKGGRDVAADLHDILSGIPLKDENNHEPTVQARQHHSSSGGVGKSAVLAAGAGATGPRHHGNMMHTTPLEIGMYVLLAAFCFAIVVFVVSCVVYASKFSPQTLEAEQAQQVCSQVGHPLSRPPASGSTPGTGLQSLGAAVGRVTGAASASIGNSIAVVKRHQHPRESTTNAHDWVWLGRATLERSSGQLVPVTANSSARSGPPLIINNNNNSITPNNNNAMIHITTNPNYAEPSDAAEEIEMAVASCLNESVDQIVERPTIDSSTYCKKDRDRDRRSDKRPHHHHRSHKSHVPAVQETGDTCWKPVSAPPPLPPHGIQAQADDDPDYKPPVPPHRNIKPRSPLPEIPQQYEEAHVQRRHHHHHSHSHNYHHNRNNNINSHSSKSILTDSQLRQQNNSSHDNVDDDDLPNPAFVEFPDSALGNNGEQQQGISSGREVKRANIVGNPMFSSTEEEDEEEEDDDDRGEEQRVREELLGLDDLNMDYDQIMEYFDNLKESNA